MAEVMKHVGKVGEKPCVVLYREVPGEAENALIVKTETLPDSQHDALMNVVGSAEAQESNDIADVLDRRQFADGQNILQALHFDRRIEKVSVDLVTLTPTPATSVSLAEVNAEIRKIKNESNPPLNTEVDPATLRESVESPVTPVDAIETDPTLAQQSVGIPEVASEADEAQIANNLLNQALILEDDAAAILRDAEAKKQEAYRLNPELKPKKGPGRPKKVV
tara:strand:- start:365 stop:1030 length:666 start_codon:yes stop_codon:yes gene_type:complete